MDFKDVQRIKNITHKEIKAIESLPVLAGTVATLHAASAMNSAGDSRYAIRCKKMGFKIKVEKPVASNMNKRGANEAAQRLKLALHKSLRASLRIVQVSRS